MSLPTRKIGQHTVNALGYGAMSLGDAYGSAGSDEDRQHMLDEVHASGATFWDTADCYFASESVIGKWFARTGKRNEIFLATKFGFQTVFDPSDPTKIVGLNINGTREWMRQQLAASLKALQTDHVELYYLHRPDTKTPIEVTVRAMAELVKEGKVKYLGLSECSAATLRRAHAVHPIAAVQVEYSPFTLDIEDPTIDLLRTARELGVAIVAYSPLGRGLLTGRYTSPEDIPADDFRRMIPKYSAENFPRILQLTEDLKSIASRHDATVSQVALAWLLSQGEDIIPIPGTRSVKYHQENMGALKVTLTEEELEEVRQAASRADVGAGGGRYPPGMQEQLYAETPELNM